MAKQPVTEEDNEERFARVLGEAARALEGADIPYAVFAGIAASFYGRPRAEHDIDLLVKPTDADRALDALEEAGFSTKKANPRWLYKAFKEEVMVDVIFRVKGDVYLDEEMISRRRLNEYNGQKIYLVAPEDAVVIEALTHGDDRPEHWYNALAIIAAESDLDWEYLERRARFGARRTLSLLIYAQSTDLMVPDELIRTLYRHVYENGTETDGS
jgi:predicted nucleotidyltransferase